MLFRKSLIQQDDDCTMQETLIPRFTRSELTRDFKELKEGKAKDKEGVSAEMLKYGGGCLVEAILALYNEIIKVDAIQPSYWKQLRSQCSSNLATHHCLKTIDL